MAKNEILTVGSMAFDTIQTPAGKAESVLGGSTNYFSIAASLYCPVHLVGVVGEDFPKDHLSWLEGRKISTSGIKIVPGKTFHWTGEYGKDLNEAKTLSTELNVFETFDPVLSEDQKNVSHVFLANIDPILQHRVLDQVKNPQLIACDSMNFWIEGKRKDLEETLHRVDILSINEQEAYLLSQKRNLLDAAKIIRDLGPSVLVVKRGEYGAVLFAPNSIYLVPAYLVDQVVDPTGAGDSFAGAFMGYLSKNGATRDLAKKDPQGWDRLLREAMFDGCVMASFTVEDFSIRRLARLERHEFEKRSGELLKMMSKNL